MINKKLYDERNELKKLTNDSKKINYPKTMQIWYVKIGKNIGFEENGKKNFLRPVLVVRTIGNIYFYIPLTTKGKNNQYYYKLSQKYGDKQSRLMLSQGRVLDAKRFVQYIGKIEESELLNIKKLLKDMYIGRV